MTILDTVIYNTIRKIIDEEYTDHFVLNYPVIVKAERKKNLKKRKVLIKNQ